MSRSRKNTKLSDEASGGFSSGGFDHEIAQLTKLRSGTSENMSKLVGGKNKGWISPVKMLAARESNFLRKSKFSTADGCHILNRYLPVNGPYLVDQMESCAYVSHFSFDGSLLVAGYQVLCNALFFWISFSVYLCFVQFLCLIKYWPLQSKFSLNQRCLSSFYECSS